MIKKIIKIYKYKNAYHLGIPKAVCQVMKLENEKELEFELVDERTIIIKKKSV